MNKKQVGEEIVYSPYTSIPLFIFKRNHDRNSNRALTWRQELMEKPWRGLLTGLLLIICSTYFLRDRIQYHNGLPPTPITN